jgi:hypothetical protein
MNAQLALLHTFRPLFLLALALTLREGRSETLVVGTNQAANFSLTVPTNQAVVIYGGRFATTGSDIYWRITQFGELHLFRMDSMTDPILTAPAGHPNILAGPLVLELFIPSTGDWASSWMSYEVVPLAGLKTLIIPGMATNTVAVAPGTNFRLLSRSSRDLLMEYWTLVSGTTRADVRGNGGIGTENLILDMEFSGPVGVEIANYSMDARWFTYSLHSGSVQMLPGGVVAAAGMNALSVEESSDLVNWSAAAVMLKEASPSRFYRLKVSK